MTATHARHAPISIPALRNVLSGQVIAPDDAAYDRARRVFYGGIDRRPVVIVRPTGASDVSQVVLFAPESGLELAVRSGGHSLAGHSTTDGGILLDLADLRALEIDPTQRTAWAQTGLTAGAYTTAANAHGLATGFGDTASVGIGGLTLGGGIGLLVRKHGLTIDDLLAAELVTADGQLLQVDADHHRELFWAIRGGGGNFGVATRLQYRLHPLDQFVGGLLILPATPQLIAGFLAEAQAAPEELSTIANILPAPTPTVAAHRPARPPGHHGHPGLRRRPRSRPAGDGPVAGPGHPTGRPDPPDALPTDLPAPGGGLPPNRGVSRPVRRPPRPRGDRGDRRAPPGLDRPGAGGAAAGAGWGHGPGAHPGHRVRPPNRLIVNVTAVYQHPEQAADHQAWVDHLAAALQDGDPRAYVNFLGDEGQARLHQAYPGPTWDRLAAIKARYDPTNLFHRNQNIPPTKADPDDHNDPHAAA